MKNLIILSFCVLNCYVILAQKNSCNNYNAPNYDKVHTEIITKQIQFQRNSSDNIFMIENVNGNIEVEGYGGNTIEIEVEKVIKSDTKANLDKGIEAIQLGVFENNNGVCLYMDAPFAKFNKDIMSFEYGKDKKGDSSENCNTNWNDSTKNSEYHYELNYKVKVPRTVNLKIDNLSGPKMEVSNIIGEMMELKNTSGHIFVNNLEVKDIDIITMSGHIKGADIAAKELSAKTMSGHVKINGIDGAATHATSMSGHVMLTYSKNPKEASVYSSMSGHVDVGFQPDLNANILQTVNNNGKLYSDFTDLSNVTNTNSKPTKSKKSCAATCNGSAKKANYKVGRGGDKFSFSTMNGHVKVRKI